MKRKLSRAIGPVFFLFACVAAGWSQDTSAGGNTIAGPVSQLPRLVRFGGVLKDLSGNPLTGVVGVTFALYSEPTGGAPLWLETQNVTADSNGHYTVLLGSTKPDGLPAELFTSEQAHWVGVQVSGQPEQPRVPLVSSPYAFKAGDAETIGGLPPSAFVLANGAQEAASGARAASTPASARVQKNSAPPANPDVTGKGVVGYIPMWDTTSDIVDSVIFQKASGIGVGTTTPAATLDVNGKSDIRDTLTLFPKSTDNTLAVNGTNFKVSSTGLVAFISGQTFPGAGTITGITTASGSGLAGGGTKGTLSLGLKTCAANQVLQYVGGVWTCSNAGTGTVTSVASGTGLTGGPITGSGTLSLAANACAAGSALSALPFTCSPFATLGANTFTGNQAIEGFNLQTYIGNPGCGPNPFAGIAFGTSGFQNCGNYSMVGDGTDTFIAAPTGDIYFRTQNNTITAITIAPAGTVNVATNLTATAYASTVPAGSFTGFSASTGSGLSGTDGVDAIGGNGDPSGCCFAGNGVAGIGGLGYNDTTDGLGGFFIGGGTGSSENNDGYGIWANPGSSGYAGLFNGPLIVNHWVDAEEYFSTDDDPTDAANRYLRHASVESSEMKNIYDGNVTTDSQGQATVQLPEWFEVLNTDFRYQLTVIGQFAQAIVAHEIENNRFEIRTSAPNVKVSWQVTGVRQDAYAKAHPLVVEQEKEARLRGFYIHPELYGAPPEKQIEWARHPQIMKKIQEMRAKQLAAIKAASK